MSVVQLRRNEHTVSSSPLDFTVYEKPMSWEDKRGKMHAVEDYKTLLRPDNNGEPVQLAVVGANYKVIQNRELFDYIGSQIPSYHTYNIRDAIAYGGAFSRRDYVFDDLKCRVGDDEIAFRARVINGFGMSAVTIAVGAIVWACDNGIIVGQYDRIVKKHTSGLTITGISDIIMNAVYMFDKLGPQWVQWLNKKLTEADVDAILEKLTDKGLLSERKTKMIRHLYDVETRNRGMNLWALYNAFTFYASHEADISGMRVRDTGKDHKSATLHKREIEVHNIVRSDTWQRIAA